MDPIESLNDELVSSLPDLPLLTVKPDAALADAVALMQQHRTGSVLVEENGRVVGIITERDVVRRLGLSAPMAASASSSASKTVWAVRKSDSLGRAVQLMNEHRCRHLAVVADDGRPAGVLSVRRIVHAIVEHFPSAVYNLPPTAKKNPDEREGA